MTSNEPSRLDRIEATQAVHSQILNEVAVAHRQLTDFATRQAEQQSQRTNQLETALTQLTNRVDVLTTTTTETIQLVAQNSVAIRDILERLDRRFNNGNGRGEG